jgi:hypothetical protein
MANEPLKGKRMVEITERKTKTDWAKFVKRIACEMYPNAKPLTIYNLYKLNINKINLYFRLF